MLGKPYVLHNCVSLSILKVISKEPESEIRSHFNSEHHSGLDNIINLEHAIPHSQRAKALRDLIEFNWILRDFKLMILD